MKRIWIAAAFALFSGAAIADGYQDFNAGVAAKNRGDETGAIAYLSSALAAPDLSDPLRATAYLARGATYAKIGKFDAAAADFSAAIKLHPDDIAALRSRATLEEHQGHPAEALADFKQAIALQPDNFLLYAELLGSDLRNKDFNAAIEIYSSFIAKRPKDASLLDNRAWMELGAEQFDKAIADTTAAAAMFDKWPDPYSIMAIAYIDAGDFNDALKSADNAIDRNSDIGGYYLQRGYAEWLLGDVESAARAFDKSLDKDAHQNYAFAWLSIATARQGKQVSADIAARFSDATEAKWPGPLVLLYLGRMQPDAVLKLTGPDPDTLGSKECTAHFYVGEWYAAQGKAADARPLLQAAAGDICKGAPMYARFAATDLGRLSAGAP